MVLKLIIIISSLSFLIYPDGRSLYDTTKKRADKEMSKYWQGLEYALEKVEMIDPTGFELYRVNKANSDQLEYVLFDEAPSKVDIFIYGNF